MIKLNLNEVKTQFSKYIEMVEEGEVVVVCKRNVPVAEIRPIVPRGKKKPQLGWAAGAFEMPQNFKEPADADVIQWEDDPDDPLRKYSPKNPED